MFNTDVVITSADIEFSKITGALKFINEVWNKRERGGVFYRDVVEVAIVLDGVELPSFFPTKKKLLAIGDFEGRM
jgi:hypothetical protein